MYYSTLSDLDALLHCLAEAGSEQSVIDELQVIFLVLRRETSLSHSSYFIHFSLTVLSLNACFK